MKRIFKNLRRRLRGRRTRLSGSREDGHAKPLGEHLEPRRLLSGDVALWHNHALPEDVNGDGMVSIRDASALYAELLAPTAIPVVLRAPASSALSPEGEGGQPFFPDVSGDNLLSPKDVRLVDEYLRAEGQNPGDQVLVDLRVWNPLTTTEIGLGHDGTVADLEQGQTFDLRVYVEDIRDLDDATLVAAEMGVIQSFLDVFWVDTVGTDILSSTGPVTAGPEYQDLTSGIVTAEVIEDAGGIRTGFTQIPPAATATPLGADPVLLFSLTFTAGTVGEATFMSDFAGPGESLATVLWGVPSPAPAVEASAIFFDDIHVNVTPGPLTVVDDYFDGSSAEYPVIQEDTTGSTTANVLDVLANDSVTAGGVLNIVDTTFTQPANGAVTLFTDTDAIEKFHYTPDPDFISGPTGVGPGPDTFTYEVNDGRVNVRTGTVYVTVVNANNDSPTAVNDNVSGNDPQFATDEDTPLTFPGSLLTANDTDPDFQVLTVTSIGPNPGPVTNNGDGTFTYTPPASFNSMQVGDLPRTDTYTYIVSDGTNTDTGTVTFTVTGVNDAPVVPAQVPAVTDDNTQIIADLDDLVTGGVVTDPEGDPIDFDGPVSGESAKGATVTVDANNVLTYNPNASATLNALLPGDAPITDTFTIKVKDDHGGSSDLVFNVTVNPADDDMTVGPQDPLPAFTNTPVTFYAAEGPVAGQTPNIGQDVSDVDSDVRFDVPLTTDKGALIVRNADGSFTYDANGVFDGVDYPATATDMFTYRVTSESDPTDYHDIEVTVNLEVDISMPNIDGSVIYSDDNNNGVQDTWERTIGGVRMELRGTTIAGVDIGTRVAYTDANGGFSFDNLIRGTYVLRQYTPQFIVDDDGPGILYDEIAINSPEDAARDYFFGEFGLHPHYIVVNDYFGSTDNNGIMFGLDASGQQLWYSLHDGWGAATSVSAQMSPDGRSLNVTVNGRAFSVSTVGNPDFLLRGTSPTGQGSVVQIYGSMNDYL